MKFPKFSESKTIEKDNLGRLRGSSSSSIRQIQELHQILSKQLQAYQKGNLEEGLALCTNLEKCMQPKQSPHPPSTESQRKTCLQIQAECQRIQEQIHTLLQKEQEQIKKEHLACQVDLALLRLHDPS